MEFFRSGLMKFYIKYLVKKVFLVIKIHCKTRFQYIKMGIPSL